jgi:purine-binding chemotaxis protein CheW
VDTSDIGVPSRTGAGSELVLVWLGSCRYAVPMDSVVEVGRPAVLTRVPGLPAWVAGVVNWRGRVLAVLDLRGLLGEATPALDRRGRLVVLSHGGIRVGLIVESVCGTTYLDLAAREVPLAHLPGQTGALLVGQVPDTDGLYGVLDVDAVFGLAATLPRARRAG